MIKFKTVRGVAKIWKVEAEKQTESSIWVGGKRRAKKGSWDNYHDTWLDAKEHLIKVAGIKLKQNKAALDIADAFMVKVHELQPQIKPNLRGAPVRPSDQF